MASCMSAKEEMDSAYSTDIGQSSDASTPPMPMSSPAFITVPSALAPSLTLPTAPVFSDRYEQARADKQHKWINRQITDAADSGQIMWLLQVIQQNLIGMNLINFSTALHRTARLALTCSQQVREQIMSRGAIRELREALVNYFIDTVHPDGTWVQQVRRAEDQASEMRCLSIICWSCATLRVHEEAIFSRASAAAQRRISEMKSFELSNLLWSFAKLSLGNVAFFEALAPHLVQRRTGQFSPQCLSTIIWSYGTLKVHHHALFTSIAKEIIVNKDAQTPQGIANTAWAFARVRRQEVALFMALGDAAVKEEVIWTFKPQEISNTVWAYATVGLPHHRLFDSMAQVVISRRWQLPPQNVANIIWAYAKLNSPARNQLFPAMLEVASSQLQHYKPQEMAAILWAVARGHGACGHDLFLEVSRHFQACLSEFSSQGLACMAEAFISAELDNLPFFNTIVDESINRLGSFQAPSLCTLLRGLALRVQRQPLSPSHTKPFDIVSEHIVGRLSEMAPHNMLHLVQTLELLPQAIRNGTGRDLESRARAVVQTSVGVYDAGAAYPSVASSGGDFGSNQPLLEGVGNDFFEHAPERDAGHGRKLGGGKGMAKSMAAPVPAGLGGPLAAQFGAAPQQHRRNKKGGPRQPNYPLRSGMLQYVPPQAQAQYAPPQAQAQYAPPQAQAQYAPPQAQAHYEPPQAQVQLLQPAWWSGGAPVVHALRVFSAQPPGLQDVQRGEVPVYMPKFGSKFNSTTSSSIGPTDPISQTPVHSGYAF